jgi:hypothetical protein
MCVGDAEPLAQHQIEGKAFDPAGAYDGAVTNVIL